MTAGTTAATAATGAAATAAATAISTATAKATAGVGDDVTTKKEGHEAASEEGAKVAVGESAAAVVPPLTLEEKQAVINNRAEERRSAVRRETLGWDRCARTMLVWFCVAKHDTYDVVAWDRSCFMSVFVVPPTRKAGRGDAQLSVLVRICGRSFLLFIFAAPGCREKGFLDVETDRYRRPRGCFARFRSASVRNHKTLLMLREMMRTVERSPRARQTEIDPAPPPIPPRSAAVLCTHFQGVQQILVVWGRPLGLHFR